MFTGIIQAIAAVQKLERQRGSLVLTIQRPRSWKLAPGQSIATNGVCLTVSKVGKNSYQAELVGETLQRTTFGKAIPKRVNLERSLTLQSPLDGHLVLGHVDAVGKIIKIVRQRGNVLYYISFPRQFSRLVASKGSVAVDGVSLTVAAVRPSQFSVALVPFTLTRTTLAMRTGLKTGPYIGRGGPPGPP